MASRFRSERPQLRTVGATSLKPAFGNSTGASRPDWSLPSRAKSQSAAAEAPRSNAIEGVQNEKPLKKSPSESGRKRKDKRHLRERRHGTGVVILPGASKNDDQESEARQTLENTKQNENIGAEAFTPSPTEVSSSNHARSSRTARDGADADKHDKQDLIDRLEKLEKSLEQKTKEVETLKTENQRLRDENNALIRVVNQVSSLKIK